MKYRKLETLDEVEQLASLMIQAAKEQTFNPRFDPLRIRKLCLRLLNRMPEADHLLAYKDDQLAGYFIWQELEDLLTGDPLLKEVSLYIVPEYRNTVTGGQIAKHFAEVPTANFTKIVVTSPDENIATLEKRGYQKYGTAMLLDKGKRHE